MYSTTIMDRRVLALQNSECLNENSDNDEIFIKHGFIKPILPYSSIKIDFTLDFSKKKNSSVNCDKEILIDIFEFLNQFEHLNSLEIQITLEEEDQYETDPKCYLYDQSLIKLNLMKVLKITLNSNEIFWYLPFFLNSMPQLVHIYIQMNSLYEEPSCVCINQNIFDYLTEGKERIKTLILDVDDQETESLIATIEGMNLETLAMSELCLCVNFTDPSKLLHLSLRNGDSNLIYKYYPNLETLSLQGCNYTNGIQKFKKLKVCRVFIIYGLKWIYN